MFLFGSAIVSYASECVCVRNTNAYGVYVIECCHFLRIRRNFARISCFSAIHCEVGYLLFHSFHLFHLKLSI